MDISTQYKKATFWRRFGAHVVDNIFLNFAIDALLKLVITDKSFLSFVLPFFIAGAYGTFFVWKKGQTIGKQLFHIKVVTENYEKVSFERALLRETFGKFISGIIIYLGYIWVLIDKKRQAWHDKIAKTYVIEVDKDGNALTVEQADEITSGQKVVFWGILFSFTLLPFIIFIIVYSFLFRPYQVNGKAMAPNYIDGQYYISSLFTFKISDPKNNDVIVFTNPEDTQKIS